MIEVTLETIQMSLVSPHRIVVLKEIAEERYLPIWIGPCEAEAIAVRLNGIEMPRPLTHDLVLNLLEAVGADLLYIYINALANNTFYARLVLSVGGEELDVDCRPSDAIAVAVRAGVPIYADETVLRDAGVVPDEDLTGQDSERRGEGLGVFRDFLSTLEMDEDSGAEN